MIAQDQMSRIDGRLRVIQIVSAAILMGALFFTCVIALSVDWELFTSDIKMLTLGGVATGFMILGLAMIVPRLITASSTQIAAQLISAEARDAAGDSIHGSRVDAGQVDDVKICDALIENLLTNRIIFSAIVEAAIFLNLIVFQLEVSVVSLMIVGLGVSMLIVAFPVRSRLITWLEQNTTDVRREMELMN